MNCSQTVNCSKQNTFTYVHNIIMTYKAKYNIATVKNTYSACMERIHSNFISGDSINYSVKLRYHTNVLWLELRTKTK